VRIVQAWAKRGWKLTGVLYNVVTTYDRVSAYQGRIASCAFCSFTKSARNDFCRYDWLIECVTALQVALDEPDTMHGAIQSTVSKSLFAVSAQPNVCARFNLFPYCRNPRLTFLPYFSIFDMFRVFRAKSSAETVNSTSVSMSGLFSNEG
jgi:hypothetical protein